MHPRRHGHYKSPLTTSSLHTAVRGVQVEPAKDLKKWDLPWRRVGESDEIAV
jgi:hypothetical protein